MDFSIFVSMCIRSVFQNTVTFYPCLENGMHNMFLGFDLSKIIRLLNY